MNRGRPNIAPAALGPAFATLPRGVTEKEKWEPSVSFVPLGTNFGCREEKGNFLGGGLGRIGTVHRICLDRLCEILADCPRSSIGRVCRSHDLAVERHRIWPFEDLNDDRARNHK